MDNKILKYSGVFLGIIFFYIQGKGTIFVEDKDLMFISVVLVSLTISYFIQKAKSGEEIYLRPLSALKAIEEAVGRATEAYLKSGRPDLFYDDMVHYISEDQFAYAAGVNGIMMREKPAACFYQGKFYAESLIFAETGNSIGAIQIAGTGSQSQIPFFVTACDYTLIGEEFFTASAYLSGKPEMLGSIKGQDIVKSIVMAAIVCVLFLDLFHQFGLFEFSIKELIAGK